MLRSRRLLYAISFLFCVCCLLVHASSAAAPAKKVYAGVYLHDVAKFEQKDGVFDADFELWVKWLGDFDATQLKIANAAEVERQEIGEEKDGQWHSSAGVSAARCAASFRFRIFRSTTRRSRSCSSFTSATESWSRTWPGAACARSFSITGWLYEPFFTPRVAQGTYRSDLGAITGEGRPTQVRRAAFEVTLRRPLLTTGLKLFLPLLVILMVAVSALFIHPKELEVRAAVGVTALLACFAFQFSVADTMPNVAYITLADVLFLVSYAVCAVLMAVSVAGYWLHEHDRPSAWKKLDVGASLVVAGAHGRLHRRRTRPLGIPPRFRAC